METFGAPFLKDLTRKAKKNARLRQHFNIHQNYEDPCQRLFNAIEPNSYIRPHRHKNYFGEELLIAVSGLMALITFNDQGAFGSCVCFGSEKRGSELTVCVEVPRLTWHTVVALETHSVLLEVKAGPFNPTQAKELATWAPEEGSSEALDYLKYLRTMITRAMR